MNVKKMLWWLGGGTSELLDVLLAYFEVANVGITNGQVLDSPAEGVDVGEITAHVVDGALSITDFRIAFTPQTTPVWGDQYIQGERVFTTENQELSIIATKTGTAGTYNIGLAYNDDFTTPKCNSVGVHFSTSNQLFWAFMGRFINDLTYLNGNEYEVKMILGGYTQDGGFTGTKKYGYYTFIRGGLFANWTMIMKGWASYYLPTTAFGLVATNWDDVSTGGNATTIDAGRLYLLDNNSTLDAQTLVRTLAYPLSDNMIIVHTLDVRQLNDASQFDPDDDGYAYILAGETGDAFISRAGASFPIVHPVHDCRAQIWLQVAQDYGTSNNIEIWMVQDAEDASGNFEFIRIYQGTGIDIDAIFDLSIEYHLGSTNDFWTVTIRNLTNGQTLVTNQTVGMANDTGGNNSLTYQCKGTAPFPVEFYVNKVQLFFLPDDKFLFQNFDGTGRFDAVRIGAKTLDVVQDFASASITVATTFEHSVNCLIQLHLTTNTVTSDLIFAFRYVDSQNYYFVNVADDGVITLNSKIANVDSLLATSSINAKNDTKICVRIMSNTCQVWIDNDRGINYATLTQFPTEQTFQMIQVPGDAVIKNIVSEGAEIIEDEPDDRITYIESTSNPVDNGSLAGTSVTVPVPSGAQAGDLIVLVAFDGAVGSNPAITGAANQTFATAQSFSNTIRIFWAKFNGDWSGNANFTVSVTTGTRTSLAVHCFRPSDPLSTWSVDNTVLATTTASGTTHTIDNTYTLGERTVTLATWIAGGAVIFSNLVGYKWAVTGSAQYRNTASTDQTMSFAHRIANRQVGTSLVTKTSGATVACAVSKVSFRETLP